MTEQWMPSELGGPVGLARENVNRQLRPSRHEGLSRMDHGRVMLDDMADLRNIAEVSRPRPVACRTAMCAGGVCASAAPRDVEPGDGARLRASYSQPVL